MENKSKISLPERVVMLALTGQSDVVSIITSFLFPLPIVGQFIKIIGFGDAVFVFVIVQGWLIMRGEKSFWFGITSAIDILSGSIIPAQTPGLLAVFIASRSKTLSAVTKIKSKKPDIKEAKEEIKEEAAEPLQAAA